VVGLAGICNLCRFPILRINKSTFGARCVRCWSTHVHRGAGRVVASLPLERPVTYELSSRGALHHYLKRRAGRFYCSEFFDDVAPGLMKRGVVCQDVQSLLLGDGLFDLVTSTEVFEHVPDDRKGFREVHRVLKRGGYLVFTVPVWSRDETVERCALRPDGTIEHFLPPEYHGDRIRGSARVLAFRDYGHDIVERLRECGFVGVELRHVRTRLHAVDEQPVLVGQKPG
jgi:SAM-dependent methyltransferase